MKLVRTLLVAATLAVSTLGAALLPTAAWADSIYPPSDSCSITPAAITPGSTVQFACDDRTFSPNEPVTITVEGATSAEIGFFRFATITAGDAVSNDTGALEAVPISFPSDARGIYNIAAVSATSAGGAASATVTNADGVGAASGLPVTGLDGNALLGLWVGGSALVLAGAAIAVAAAVRHRRARTDQ